jgi:hypothetical protein
MEYDFLIVESGFFGSICVYELTKKGYKCLEYVKDNEPKNLYAWSFEYFWALLFNKIHENK